MAINYYMPSTSNAPFVLRLLLDNSPDSDLARSHDWKFDPWKSNRPYHERSYTCRNCGYWLLLSRTPDTTRILNQTTILPHRIYVRARHWVNSIDRLESCKEVIMKEALE